MAFVLNEREGEGSLGRFGCSWHDGIWQLQSVSPSIDSNSTLAEPLQCQVNLKIGSAVFGPDNLHSSYWEAPLKKSAVHLGIGHFSFHFYGRSSLTLSSQDLKVTSQLGGGGSSQFWQCQHLETAYS